METIRVFFSVAQMKFFPGPTYCGQQTSVSTGVFMTPSRQMVWNSEIGGKTAGKYC